MKNDVSVHYVLYTGLLKVNAECRSGICCWCCQPWHMIPLSILTERSTAGCKCYWSSWCIHASSKCMLWRHAFWKPGKFVTKSSFSSIRGFQAKSTNVRIYVACTDPIMSQCVLHSLINIRSLTNIDFLISNPFHSSRSHFVENLTGKLPPSANLCVNLKF